MSFPRASRLLKPSDFKRVFSKPTVSADRYFKVLGRRNPAGPCRLGMAVSRQVDKHAVGRNRIKRLIREHFRHTYNGGGQGLVGGIQAGIDLVVLPRRACATISNCQLIDSLANHSLRITRALERERNGVEQQTPRPVIRRANQDAGTN